MSTSNEKLLIISGPVGVGKTTVANELSTLLEKGGVPHTYIDLDALTYTFPRTDADPYGNQLALENLKAIWQNSRKRNIRNLIVPRVIEAHSHASDIAQAVGISQLTICRLGANDETLLERVRCREIGSSLEWHEKRSLELSKSLAAAELEDFCLVTDGCSVTDIATEVLHRIEWG